MTMQNSRKLHLEEVGSLETSALGEMGLRQVKGGGWNKANRRMLPVPESRFELEGYLLVEKCDYCNGGTMDCLGHRERR